MKKTMCLNIFRAAAFAGTAFAVAGAARADFVAQPYGWLYEAERTSNASVREDASASGGALASSTQPWQPLATVAKLPSGLPERVEVWTRRRGGPICLKAVAADGSQRELAWTWGEPRRLTWQKSADLQPGDRAGGLLVIKNGDAAETSLDALALVANAAAAAVAFAPPPVKASVAVDWKGRSTHALTPLH